MPQLAGSQPISTSKSGCSRAEPREAMSLRVDGSREDSSQGVVGERVEWGGQRMFPGVMVRWLTSTSSPARTS